MTKKNIIDNNPITTKNFRINKTLKKNNKQYCTCITNYSKLTKKLKKIKKNLCNDLNNSCKYLELNIIPYCNESNKNYKHTKNLHTINDRSISKKLLDKISTLYNISFNIDSNYFTLDKNTLNLMGPKNSPYKFLKYLINIPDMEDNAMIIISHSTFLRNLASYISNLYNINNLNNEYNNYMFDNLDIFQLTLYGNTINNNNIGECAILRWKNNYQLKTNLIRKKNSKTFFLMRHCIACHNNPTFTESERIVNKSLKEWSLCYPSTIDELKQKKKYLLNIFKDWGGVNNIKFGSSIILRSILTCIILLNSIS